MNEIKLNSLHENSQFCYTLGVYNKPSVEGPENNDHAFNLSQ